ncbi:hypothetical protein CFC21_044472 [Triticum aestivum]|uniref:EF-hand domain-containing protein n=2 Tax=Triticum aestivum TaxID=4565 RepID=A0A9R1JXN2_WHEAT|nr:hypothetical protein CFC21_044472 [Triticum aestivum]
MVHAATAECFSSVFASFDRDADDRISAAELRLCMKAALGEDVSAEDAKALVASADANGDRLLDEQEFLRLVVRSEMEEEEEERCRGLKEAFAMYEAGVPDANARQAGVRAGHGGVLRHDPQV